jgi:hypothetical protein
MSQTGSLPVCAKRSSNSLQSWAWTRCVTVQRAGSMAAISWEQSGIPGLPETKTIGNLLPPCFRPPPPPEDRLTPLTAAGWGGV